MIKVIIEKFFSFITQHFELLTYMSGYSMLLLIVVAVAVRLSDYPLRRILHSTIRGILFTVLIVGQTVLLVALGYLYWKNYNKPAPQLHQIENMNANTYWIKDDTRIYFIDETTLRTIQINGFDSRDVYSSDSKILAYHFSPDGKYIVVVTRKDLVLVERKSHRSRTIDTLTRASTASKEGQDQEIRGSISGIQWSPDSKRFCYEMARWSRFGSQDNIYIYSIDDDGRRSIKSPTRRISSLYWDELGKNLYYLRHETQDPAFSGAAFDVKIFRIPLSTLVPELITQIPFEDKSIPIESLEVRGIKLFLGGSKLSFSLTHKKDHLISEKGSSVGIDDNDYLYFKISKWFRRRLFKIPRKASKGGSSRYQYKGGDLVIDQIRWIPGGRFVIMDYKYLGVLILDPYSGKFGVLVEGNGGAFGWFKNKGL